VSDHWEVLAADIMSVPVVSVPPATRLDTLAEVMREHSIGAVTVADAALRPLGIVTKADLILHGERSRKRRRLTAGDIMSRPLRTVDPETPINAISEMFDGLGIRHVPVVANGRLVGIVSDEDLKHRTATPGNRRSTAKSDEELRASVFEALSRIEPSLAQLPDFSIDNGVVHFWGDAPPSDEELEAVIRAVRAAQS